MPSRPLLCLLPGLLCDATVWAPQREAFASLADVHVAELWGLDSFEAMARKTLAETSGPLAVAGHSMGARVALEMWRLAPGRIERLALMSTGVHAAGPGEEGPRMGMVRLAREQGMGALVQAWLRGMVHPDRWGDEALIGPLADMIGRATPDIFEGQQRAGLTRPDATAYLPNIRCPTLIACGRQDSWSPAVRHQEMAGALPGSTLAIFEECGHMATVERPQAVIEAMAGWLQQPAAEKETASP